jgi:hypothetical protein
LNPIGSDSNSFYSEGNLKFLSSPATAVYSRGVSSIPVSSGKWYFEMSGVGDMLVAEADNYLIYNSSLAGSGEYAYGFYNGNKNHDGSSVAYGASFSSTDVIGCALDLDAGSITFYKNNVSQGVAFTGLTATSYVVGSLQRYNRTTNFNFGQDSSFAGNKTAQGNTDANGIGDFYYAPPAGYLALCTANLPDPAIDPAQDDVPADYFNTVLYQGDGSSPRSVTGVGFQPDLVWMKSRSDVLVHGLYDGVRGTAKLLISNSTSAEIANDPYGYISSYDSDGFTLTAGGISNDTFNRSTDAYVSWNWLAGNGTSTNTDGTITSTVSANQKAGFSIVKVDSLPASTLSTFGHGLGVKPDMIIFKSRNNSANWDVYHSSLTPDGERKLYLNDTSAEIDSGFMGDTPPTSSVISFNPGGSTSNHIAYCFHSVEGYSKFGSYTGNGSSSDGPFIYTGFRPAFVMIKRTDAAGRNWMMQNNKSNPYNVVASVLSADVSDQEYTSTATGGYGVDFVSNGLKIVNDNINWNASGGTYIYMAFAEMPFKYSNAR